MVFLIMTTTTMIMIVRSCTNIPLTLQDYKVKIIRLLRLFQGVFICTYLGKEDINTFRILLIHESGANLYTIIFSRNI